MSDPTEKNDPSLCCRDVNDFLAVYLEDGLDEQVRARFEAHVGHCPKCSDYFRQYRTTVEMVHEAGDIPPPPEVLVDATLAFLRKHLGDDEATKRGREAE